AGRGQERPGRETHAGDRGKPARATGRYRRGHAVHARQENHRRAARASGAPRQDPDDPGAYDPDFWKGGVTVETKTRKGHKTPQQAPAIPEYQTWALDA